MTNTVFRCESARSCRLAANSDVFGHTCDDVTTYLEVEYTCRIKNDIGEDHDAVTPPALMLLANIGYTVLMPRRVHPCE